MPNIRISDMPLATTPLVGDELIEVVQGGFSRQIDVDDVIAAAAALDATFVTVTANPNLDNERILTGGTNVALVDSGAGNALTIDVTIPSQNPFATPLGILGDINTATPPAGELITALLELRDLQNVNTIGSLGYNTANDQFLQNFMEGGFTRVTGTQTGGGLVDLVTMLPDGYSTFHGHGATASGQGWRFQNLDAIASDPGLNLVGIAAGFEEVWRIGYSGSHFFGINCGVPSAVFDVQCRNIADTLDNRVLRASGDGDIELYHNAIEVFHTATANNGGAEVLNTATGGPGFERVLTVSDQNNPINTFNYNFDTNIVMADPGAGGIRFNNATPGSASTMAISHTDADGNDLATAWVDSFNDGYMFSFGDPSDPDNRKSYSIDQTGTDFGAWTRFDLIPFGETGPGAQPANGARVQCKMDSRMGLQRGAAISGMGTPAIFNTSFGYTQGAGVVRLKQGFTTDFAIEIDETQATTNVANAFMGCDLLGTVEAQLFYFPAASNQGFNLTAEYTGIREWIFQHNSGSVNDFGITETGIKNYQPVYILERAAAAADITTWGQFWVSNAATQVPMFTDESGVDSILNAVSGAQISGTPVNNQIAVWTGATDIEGGTDLTWDGTTLLTGRINGDLDGLGLFLQNFGAGTEIVGISADGSGTVDFDFTNVGDVNFNGGDIYDFSNELLRSISGLFIQERAADQGDIANQGQFWVEDTSPNRAMFTTGDGDIFALAYAPGEVTLNASHNFNTAGNFAENWIGSYDSGANFTVTLEDSGSVVQWPVGTAIQVINPGSGVITIAEGSGVTLFLDDGTDTVGGATVTQGVVTIFRQTTANYIIFGSGIA